MSNAVITPSAVDFRIAGSTRVHAMATLDLSSSDPGEITVEFPFTGTTAPQIRLRHGSVEASLPVPAAPVTGFTGVDVTYTVNPGSGPTTRTVFVSIADNTGVGPNSDAWVLKLIGIPAGPDTVVTWSGRTTAMAVEADPIVHCTALPATVNSGTTLTLTGSARRNTSPVPTTASYGGPRTLLWSQVTSVASAAPSPTSEVPAVVDTADGFNLSASVALPPFGTATTLDYILNADFDEFHASCTVTTSAQSQTHYWILALDRSKTMADGTPAKADLQMIAAQIWVDLISGFRFAPGITDQIGVVTFNDPHTGGFRASGPDPAVALRWPAAGALGPLVAVTDAAMDGFKVGGTPVVPASNNQTPLGDALIASLDAVASVAGASGFAVDMLVLTDGIENSGTVKVDRLSTITGTGVAATFDDIKADPASVRSHLVLSQTGNVRLYPVGTGVAPGVNTTVLSNLGTNGYGPYTLAASCNELFPVAFGSDLFPTALNASQQAVATLPSTGTDSSAVAHKQVYLAVANNETKLVIIVLWPTPGAGRTLEVRWRDQGATGVFNDVTATPNAAKIVSRGSHGVAVVDLTKLTNTAKDWRISVLNGAVQEDVDPFNVLAGRDLYVRPTITLDRTEYFNDEPIVVQASVHAGSEPISDATITVEVDAPALSEGELLAANPRAADQPMPPMPEKTKLHLPWGSRELILARALSANKLKSIPSERHDPAFVDGTNVLRPDSQAGPGHYMNVFTRTWREGRYTFRCTIAGRTAKGGKFSDVVVRTCTVRVRADDVYSTVAVSRRRDMTAGGLEAAQVTVTPRDALGQRLGPFHAEELEFHTSRGAFVPGIETGFDGSYTKVLLFSPGQRPVVTVGAQGRAFTPVLVAGGLHGFVTSLVRRVLSWLIRSARNQ